MEDLSQTYHAIKELLHPKALKEKDLMSHDNPITLKADKSYPITLDYATFSFGAGAEMDVKLFNDEDDKDENAFIATKDCPIVLNTATDAYLKYTTAVSAKANAQVTLASLGFESDLSASGCAKAIFYKRHPNGDLVREAFAADLKKFRTIFKFEDVESLEENNGLGFLVNGTLSCNLKVSWSNILSTGLTTVSDLLPLPITLDISVVPTLTASFNLTVTDDFSYLLKKAANDQYLVTITKNKSSSATASLSATVGVQFADPTELGTQVAAITDKIVQSVLGNTMAEINTAIEGFIAGNKSAIVESLLKLFQLDKLSQPLDLLTPKLTQLETDIGNAVTKLATESVTFSVSYTYSRIEQTKELLSILIAGSDLKNYHTDLLKFKPGRLLDAIRNNSVPVTLISYLNQKILTITKSWGLGLTLFNFTLLSSKDFVESKDTILTDLKGTSRKIQMDRTKGYKWQLGKGSGSWTGTFSAAMSEFSTTPTLDEFAYTLLFNTVLKDPNVGETDLRAYLDGAAVWGAVNCADIDKLVKKYNVLLGKEVLAEFKLLFPDPTMRALLSAIAADGWGPANKKQLAKAMGATIPYMPDYELRATPEARQDVYTDLFANYLDNPDQEPDDLAALAESEIRGMSDKDHLAEFEANPDNWIFGNTFAGVIRSNPGLQDCFKDFIGGILALQSKIKGAVRYTDLDGAYNDIARCMKYQFGLAAAGRFLLEWAIDLNVDKDVKKVLTLSYGPDNNRTVINVSVV